MTRPQTLLAIGLTVAAGLGGYAATLATRPATTPAIAADPATEALLDWLNPSPAQRAELRGHDTTFAADLHRLRTDLGVRRAELAATLQDTSASESAVMGRVDAVTAASGALERRVAKYLLTVREHLTPEQQRRLFGLCAETVREGRGRQWRGGRGPVAESAPAQAPPRQGHGPGMGTGRGMGGRHGMGRGEGAEGMRGPASRPVSGHP